jgi:hypothetical protein
MVKIMEETGAVDKQGWDGYLISLARSFGATAIYSMDRNLSRIREIATSQPI